MFSASEPKDVSLHAKALYPAEWDAAIQVFPNLRLVLLRSSSGERGATAPNPTNHMMLQWRAECDGKDYGDGIRPYIAQNARKARKAGLEPLNWAIKVLLGEIVTPDA